MAKNKKVAVEIQGDLDALHMIWGLLEEVLTGIPEEQLPDEDRYVCLVSVQEMVTNVLRHGYSNDSSLPIRVEVEVTPEEFTIRTIDVGPPFNPDFGGVNPNQEGEEVSEGGYGIMIMRSVMDDVEYKREEDRNFLTMTKKLVPLPVLVGTGETA